MSKNILVTGATGKQGGALIKALLASNDDFNIFGLTRSTTSASAKALQQQSPKIKLIQGDLDDPAPIFKSASNIWGVFSVQTPYGPNTSPDNEEKQGKALVDLALANNVKHFVYSSVDRGTERPLVPTPVPHFISKHHIEEYLRTKAAGSSMSYTIIQPAAFLDNFAGEFGPAFPAMWKVYLGEDKKLQVIATTDIGKAAAAAFLNPEKYAGREIPLAGDDLNYKELVRSFKDQTGGKDLPEAPQELAKGVVEDNEDLKAMWLWFADKGYGVDIPALKKEFPELLDYATWLKKEGGY
ncbi:hypothetical protein SLS57_000475 [Botryosphaeria dothidea]